MVTNFTCKSMFLCLCLYLYVCLFLSSPVEVIYTAVSSRSSLFLPLSFSSTFHTIFLSISFLAILFPPLTVPPGSSCLHTLPAKVIAQMYNLETFYSSLSLLLTPSFVPSPSLPFLPSSPSFSPPPLPNKHS